MSKQKLTAKEIKRLEADALKYIIPHFASNAELDKGPKIFTRGEGCYVWDAQGRKYFDSFATLLTTVPGHCHPDISRAIKEQLDQLEFFPNYVDSFTAPLVELGRKVADVMPGDLGVSFFVNSGSEANETAMKMARQYHLENGERHRFKFVARKDSYHATTLGASSVTGLNWFREYFEPLLPGCVFAGAARDRDRPRGMSSRAYGKQCLAELEELFAYEGPETICAMIMDPIPGSNTGYPLPPDGYLEGVRRLCDEHGVLLIFDEVQTGFGKTGKWFACEHWNVVPDIMTIGKGFSGGYVPLGATVTTPKIAKVFRKGPGSEFRSGSTYGGHTLACAAALANIEVIEREGLVRRAAKIGAQVEKRLKRLMKANRHVGDFSGKGLLWAIWLMADRAKGKPFDASLGIGTRVRDHCHKNGMILRNNGDILVIAPSLTITDDETEFMMGLIEEAIEKATAKV